MLFSPESVLRACANYLGRYPTVAGWVADYNSSADFTFTKGGMARCDDKFGSVVAVRQPNGWWDVFDTADAPYEAFCEDE